MQELVIVVILAQTDFNIWKGEGRGMRKIEYSAVMCFAFYSIEYRHRGKLEEKTDLDWWKSMLPVTGIMKAEGCKTVQKKSVTVFVFWQ